MQACLQLNTLHLSHLHGQDPYPVSSIIICADDFAITPEISEGITRLAVRSRISATSVMSLSPHWPANAKLLQSVKHQIDVGLHVDFTSEYAIQQGQGASLGAIMLKTCLRQMVPADIVAHLNRQFDLFEAHHGAPPHHVDGHQHVHQFPMIRDALVNVMAHRYANAQMPWLRISKIPSHQMNVKAAVINAMGANSLQRLATQQRIPCSSFLTGIYDFVGGASGYSMLVQDCLSNVPTHTVLMCHPGLAGQHAAPFPEARLWEQAFFQSHEFEEVMAKLQLRLVRGSQSLRPQD